MDPNPYQAPSAASPAVVDNRTDLERDLEALGVSANRGARIAGVLMLVNAGFNLLERIVAASVHAAATSNLVAAVLDILIGISLVRGSTKWRGVAMFRVCAGAVLLVVGALSRADYFSVALQLAISGSFLALLTGNPSRPRIVIACVVFALYALLVALGLIGIAAGVTALA